MSGLTTNRTKHQSTSDLINLDTYTTDTHLIVSKAIGDKTYIGRAYVMSPLAGGGTDFAMVVKSVFKAAPDDSVIQVSLVCAPDYDAPAVFSRAKVHGGPVVQELISRQANVFKKATTVNWQPDIPLLNRRTLLISLAIPVKNLDKKALAEAYATQTEFHTGLKGSGFYDAKVLSAGDLIGYYRQFAGIFSPHSTVYLDELVELKFQTFTPEQEIDFRDSKVGLFGGNTYCATVTAKSYPEECYQGLMNLVVGAPFNGGTAKEGGGQRILTPYVFTTTVRIGNQQKEMDRVKNAIKSRINQSTLPFKLGNEDPVAALADLQHLESVCATDEEKFVYVSTSAFLFGRTPAQVREAATHLKNTFDKLDFDGRECRNDALIRWAQALPLNFAPGIANKLNCEAIMPSSAATCLLPVYADCLGNANTGANSSHTGATFITRRGSAHYFDPYVTNNNPNGLIAAASGSGKSFALQYLVNVDLAEGYNVFLIDNGKSQKKYCNAVGGEFVDFSRSGGNTPSLNPYTGLNDMEFDEQQEGITALFLLMAYENETPQNGARIAMSEAVRAAYAQKHSEAGLETVIDSLAIIYDNLPDKSNMSEVQSAARNLVPRLRAFLESPSRGKFFRGRGTINPTAQFTVFELSGLDGDEHLRRCVLFFVLNSLMTRIRDVKGRKRVYIDEAFDLLKDPGVADALEGIYLKGRKNSVSIWIVIQSLLKLITIPAGSVIMKQSKWKVILAQTADEIDEIIKKGLLPLFEHDEYFHRLLKSVYTEKGVFSELLFIGEGYYEIARLYVDKFTGALFSSDGDNRDAVFELMLNGANAIDAVNTILGDKQAKNSAFIKEVAEILQRDGLTPAEILRSFELATQ